MGVVFEPDSLLLQIREYESLAQDPKLWDDPARASAILKHKSALENKHHNFVLLSSEFEAAREMIMESKTAKEVGEAIDGELVDELRSIGSQIRMSMIESLFTDEADYCSCFLSINSGAGGTESNDWAMMLMRMYIRWGARRKYTVDIVDSLAGEEAGIKSATIKITGKMAYGWAKTESGVHRLVRISPFNANGKRHTSFCSVSVSPIVDDRIDIVINDSDVKIDTFGASGAGGQHVNKTDSAVRITHLPTGIMVTCQNDRSQHKNKESAMSILKSKLYDAEMNKRKAQAQKVNSMKTDIAWGHQIRSYVLQPYQMVKDARTDFESSNAGAVLDGALDDFIMAALLSEKKENLSDK